MEIKSNHVIDPQEVKAFMLAGNSIFTVLNKRTEGHMTFKVSQKKAEEGKEPEPLWFVSVCTAYDTYICIGRIVGKEFIPSKKYNGDSSSIKSFQILWNRYGILKSPMDDVEFLHSDRCARCGRIMTDPESLAYGMGPYCREVAFNSKWL